MLGLFLAIGLHASASSAQDDASGTWQATPAAQPKPPAPALSTPDPAQTAVPPLDISPVTLSATLVKSQTIPLSLATALQAVEDQNLSIAAQREGEKVERARFYQSLTQFLPDVEGFYGHRRFQGVIQIFGNQTLKIYQTSIEPGLAANLRIWPGGKTVFDALAAHRRVRASDALLKETHQEQLARAAADYYGLLEAQLKRDFAQKNLQEAQEQTAINQARYDAGVGTRLETLQAQTLEAQRVRQLIDANNAISLAEQALLNRLNLDTTVSLTPDLADAQTHRLVPEDLTPEKLIAHAQFVHPTLARLRQQRSALKWQGRSILSEAVPSVDLNTSVSYRGPAYDKLGLTRVVGLNIQTALGDKLGLSIPSRWLEAHRMINQLEIQSQQVMRDIESQVISAFLDSKSAASAIEAVREERHAAEESYRLAVGRYKAGVGVNLDVISAESALSEARAQLAQAVANFNRAQVRLVTAAGLASRQTLTSGLTPDALSADAQK